jgi:hypothetical protein
MLTAIALARGGSPNPVLFHSFESDLAVIAPAGAAVVRTRALPRWSAPFALLAGLAFIADGITVGTDGFNGGIPNLWPGRHSSCSPSSRESPPGGVAVATGPPSTNKSRVGLPATEITGNAARNVLVRTTMPALKAACRVGGCYSSTV